MEINFKLEEGTKIQVDEDGKGFKIITEDVKEGDYKDLFESTSLKPYDYIGIISGKRVICRNLREKNY